MRLGLYYALTVPYAAGFACFSGPMVGGYRITGWLVAAMLIAAPMVFVLDRTPSRFPGGIWIPWVLIVILSLTWATRLNLSSVQNVVQIITPFVIAPLASKGIKTTHDLDALLRSFFHCLLIMLAGLCLHVGFGVGIVARPMALTATIVGCVFVAQIRERPLIAVLGWCGCLLIAGMTGGRMATLAILLLWIILPRYRRQLTRVLVAGVIAVIAIGLFYSPTYQERFFPDSQGTLRDVSRGDFVSSGRFEVWPELWQEVARRPLLGAGAQASAAMVSQVWEDMIHPHNDYLRILLEQGFIGLTFFLVGVLGQLLSLWNRGFLHNDRIVVVRSAAYMGIFVFLLTAATDNPIVYGAWFMNPLFVLIGASYGSSAAPREDQMESRHARRG